MSGQDSLSSLCIICHNNPPKYCCPGCHRRTCSLKCYQVHKERSQCSGKRNPAAYLKRSQLETPEAIDHDFNFLTGLEKSLDRADQDAEERGIILEPFDDRRYYQSLLQRRLREVNTRIHYAPKGMSRQKANQTRWFKKSKCIGWTLEWIGPDGKKDVSHNAPETWSVQDAYLAHKVHQENRLSKLDGFETSKQFEQANNDIEKQKSTFSGHDVEMEIDGEGEAIAGQQEPARPSARSEQRARIQSTLDKLFFYHLKVHTASPHRVLRPVSQDASLADCLSDQEVLEFPTFVVLQQAPTSLPDGYILESTYQKETQRMIEELEDNEAALGGGVMQPTPIPDREEGTLPDDRRLMQSLQQDIAGMQ